MPADPVPDRYRQENEEQDDTATGCLLAEPIVDVHLESSRLRRAIRIDAIAVQIAAETSEVLGTPGLEPN